MSRRKAEQEPESESEPLPTLDELARDGLNGTLTDIGARWQSESLERRRAGLKPFDDDIFDFVHDAVIWAQREACIQLFVMLDQGHEPVDAIYALARAGFMPASTRPRLTEMEETADDPREWFPRWVAMLNSRFRDDELKR